MKANHTSLQIYAKSNIPRYAPCYEWGSADKEHGAFVYIGIMHMLLSFVLMKTEYASGRVLARLDALGFCFRTRTGLV